MGTSVYTSESQTIMTHKEFKSIFFKENEKRGKLKIFLLCFLGAIIGWSTSFIYNAVTAPQIYTRKSAYAIDYYGYLGVVVDRNLTSTCDFHPNRIIFRFDSVNNQSIPVVLPVGDQSTIWPVLGDTKVLMLVAKISDLPPGRWQIQTFYREDCYWWNNFAGARLEATTPVSVIIPPAKN